MNATRLILILCLLLAATALGACRNDEQIIQKHEQMLEEDE